MKSYNVWVLLFALSRPFAASSSLSTEMQIVLDGPNLDTSDVINLDKS